VIEFEDFLVKEGIDSRSVMVMRHRPSEKALRDVLPWLAEEQPDVYNAYQSEHGEKVENALSKAAYLASFIGHEAGRALFVGIYSVVDSRRISIPDFWKVSQVRKLKAFGINGPAEGRSPLWFDLRLSAHLDRLKGRLIVDWPGIERSWWRWADRNHFAVHAICEESLLVRPMPDWHALTLSWQELQVLPASWKNRLQQWRGIYFIFDRSARMGYVGSACGGDNLLGRWKDYAATGHGGNRLLRNCDPENFSFSILQRVSPDMERDEINRLESSWKDRLHTRAPMGLNDN
jgi:hypothetical protein